MGFTDTDDAIIEKEAGKPVEIVYLDSAQDQAGTLFFPNTLSILKDCPHPENARKLVEFLLSPEVELALANSPSAQIPVNPAIEAGEDFTPRVATPATVKPMEVDWDAVADNWDASVEWVKETFGE
jgi:iron(III) transport system substrate-binding protein